MKVEIEERKYEKWVKRDLRRRKTMRIKIGLSPDL